MEKRKKKSKLIAVLISIILIIILINPIYGLIVKPRPLCEVEMDDIQYIENKNFDSVRIELDEHREGRYFCYRDTFTDERVDELFALVSQMPIKQKLLIPPIVMSQKELIELEDESYLKLVFYKDGEHITDPIIIIGRKYVFFGDEMSSCYMYKEEQREITSEEIFEYIDFSTCHRAVY